MIAPTRRRSELLAILRQEREFREVRDLFHVLLMARLDETLIPELFEIAGRETALALLDLLAGETVEFPEAGVLEALVRKAAVYRGLSELPETVRRDRRTREWKSAVARLAAAQNTSPKVISGWFDEVDGLLRGVEL